MRLTADKHFTQFNVPFYSPFKNRNHHKFKENGFMEEKQEVLIPIVFFNLPFQDKRYTEKIITGPTGGIATIVTISIETKDTKRCTRGLYFFKYPNGC